MTPYIFAEVDVLTDNLEGFNVFGLGALIAF